MKKITIRIPNETAVGFDTFCKEEGLTLAQGIDALLTKLALEQIEQIISGRHTDKISE